jgi:hypothetical protein
VIWSLGKIGLLLFGGLGPDGFFCGWLWGGALGGAEGSLRFNNKGG